MRASGRGALYQYLDCGIFECGVARARCGECGHDFFVAFSCKPRCLCPSCHQKRELFWADWAEAERLEAVLGLSAYPDLRDSPEAMELLKDARDDPDEAVRLAAALGMIEFFSMNDPAAQAVLTRAIRRPEPSVRVAAAMAARRILEDLCAVPELQEAPVLAALDDDGDLRPLGPRRADVLNPEDLSWDGETRMDDRPTSEVGGSRRFRTTIVVLCAGLSALAAAVAFGPLHRFAEGDAILAAWGIMILFGAGGLVVGTKM